MATKNKKVAADTAPHPADTANRNYLLAAAASAGIKLKNDLSDLTSEKLSELYAEVAAGNTKNLK